MDYSTLARAEAAAQQDDSAAAHVGSESAFGGGLQRSRPLPSSSDAGHLALAADQAGDADAEGSSQVEWNVASTQDTGRESAFEELAGSSGEKELSFS